MAITIYGASDDLIEIEGDVNDEFYLPLRGTALVWLVSPYDDGFSAMTVMVDYCVSNPNGWSVAVMANTGNPPDWKVTFHPREHDTETTDPAVTIDTPPGTVVTWYEEC